MRLSPIDVAEQIFYASAMGKLCAPRQLEVKMKYQIHTLHVKKKNILFSLLKEEKLASVVGLLRPKSGILLQPKSSGRSNASGWSGAQIKM